LPSQPGGRLIFNLPEFKNLEGLIYDQGKLYSGAITAPQEISVCYTTTITIFPLSDWRQPRAHKLAFDHVILHKRHITAGFSHILFDELFQLFYVGESAQAKIDGILNLENPDRKSHHSAEWPDWIESYLDHKVLPAEPGNQPILIRNAYVGWLNIHHIARRDPDFDRMKFVNRLKLRVGAQPQFSEKKIIFETRQTNDPRFARSSGRRQITNIAELKDVLSDLRVEFLSLGDLSIQEQIRTVASAQVLIGQHGAAICNSVFMNPGASVIEILPWDHQYNGFMDLSKLFGVSHNQYREEESRCRKNETLRDDPRAYIRDQIVDVNPQRLREHIERVLD